MTSDRLIRRLRWVMAGVIVLDTINTLLGQPARYWQHPASGRELNQFIQLFVIQGWLPFLLWSLLYVAGIFAAVSVLPRRCALVVLFAFTFGHYFGASTWWVYHWGYGAKAGIIYGIVLAVILVLCGVGGPESRRPPTSHPKDGKG